MASRRWVSDLVFFSRHDHGLVARDIGLRRQHVHALRTAGARRSFKRKRGQLRCGETLQAGSIKGIEHADNHAASPDMRNLAVQWAANFEHDVGRISARCIGDLYACCGVGRVRNAGGNTSARLDANRVA